MPALRARAQPVVAARRTVTTNAAGSELEHPLPKVSFLRMSPIALENGDPLHPDPDLPAIANLLCLTLVRR